MNNKLQLAHNEHRPALIQLLRDVDLPTDDLPTDISAFVVAFQDDELIGSAGIEAFGDIGLLRSVAVHPSRRSQQVGQALVDRIQAEAQQLGVKRMFLITTTADAYFERQGFVRVSRADVPLDIASTRQFSDICPSSAIVMAKQVG